MSNVNKLPDSYDKRTWIAGKDASTVAEILLDAPLYEGDYIRYNMDGSGELVRKMQSVVFDGSESGWYFEQGTDTDYFHKKLSPSAKGRSVNVYSSHFKNDGTTGTTENNIYTNSDGRLLIRTNKFTSLAEWRAWLAENPITVVYELAEPTVTPLTAEQIAELAKIYTFDNDTTVDYDGNISITYLKKDGSTATASGVNPVIADSDYKPAVEVNANGVTRQQTYTGKNLVYKITEGGLGTNGSVSSNESYRTIYATLPSAGKYFLNISADESIHITRYMLNEKVVEYGRPANTRLITVTEPTELVLSFRNTDTTNVFTNLQVQIELGETATDYEIFVGGTASPNPDYPQDIYGMQRMRISTSGKRPYLTGSNNFKLLNINEQAIADVKADAQAVFDALDIMKATGRTLELYGDMIGQKRGALNDTQYRIMIFTRLGINVTQGNYETVIHNAKRMFDCEASDIVLRDGKDACTVEIEKFPLEVLISSGFTSAQAVELLEYLLPIGVTIDNANFDGTFEFADTADVYDEQAGFGNVEQTIGGYLGLLMGDDENSPVLPL